MPRLCCLAVLLPLAAAPLQSATLEVPVYPVPEDNAFDYYVRATELFPEARPWDEAAGQLDALDPAQAELMVVDAAAALEEFRLGLDKECLMPGGGDFSTLFPYLAQFRSLTRLLMVESCVRQERGDMEQAFGSCLDALKLGRDTARGGPIIHKLVSIACETMALQRIRALAPMAGDAEALQHALTRLGEVEAREVPLSEALAIEWDWTRRSLEGWKADPEKRKEIGQLVGKPGVHVTDAVLDEACTQLEAYYARMIAVAETDYWRWTQEAPAVPKGNPLVELIVPALGKTRERDVRHLADLRGTLIAVALELYFARNGAYPETLAELAPEVMAAVPIDPFSGEAFCYRREGELTYTLYSVGLNRVDDGGQTANAAGETLDIVFSAVE